MAKYSYKGKISVELDELPSIQLKTIDNKVNHNVITRLALATKRRFFTLQHDWEVVLSDIDYMPELNGTITVFKDDKQGNDIEYDGASVPLPWLVSLLTIGILRPLGVMLIASIVHDYAYRTGRLYKKNGTSYDRIEVDRCVADKLFRDIIATVNNLPIVAYIAWIFIRLGWPFVKYHGKTRFWNYPFIEYGLIALSVFGIYKMLEIYTFNMRYVLYWALVLYVLSYVFSLIMLKIDQASNKNDK